MPLGHSHRGPAGWRVRLPRLLSLRGGALCLGPFCPGDAVASLCSRSALRTHLRQETLLPGDPSHLISHPAPPFSPSEHPFQCLIIWVLGINCLLCPVSPPATNLREVRVHVRLSFPTCRTYRGLELII